MSNPVPTLDSSFYNGRCKSCVHWKKHSNEKFDRLGNCTEPTIKFLHTIIIPDFFGCMWYQPGLSEKLKLYQIKLPK